MPGTADARNLFHIDDRTFAERAGGMVARGVEGVEGSSMKNNGDKALVQSDMVAAFLLQQRERQIF